MTGFTPLGEEPVYDGWVISVVKGTFAGPNGESFERDIVHHPGAVAIVAIDGDEIVLVRQYRAAIDALLLEIPAGLRDIADEPLEQTARRELVEEVGLSAGSMELLTTIHNSAGFSDEAIAIFLATDLTPVERELTDSPEELAMETLRMTLGDAEAMINRGEITDAKTIIGVLAALRR